MTHVPRWLLAAPLGGVLLVPLTAFPAEVAVKPGQLPVWKAPPAYSVDLVMTSEGQTFTMKRRIDKGRIRSDVDAGGQKMVMIEPGGKERVMYSLIPDQKMAIKQTMPEVAASPDSGATAPEIVFVGKEDLNGTAAGHYRVFTGRDTVDAWFDAKTDAPLRMEAASDGGEAVIEWKNLTVGPQPDTMFEIPKGYRTMDMDAMMAQAREAMAGMQGMQGKLAGAIPGVPSGGDLGKSLGESFGGVLGNTATPYLDGQVGSWVGAKGSDTQ